LGAAVAGAKVALLRNDQRVTETASDQRGGFSFDGLAEGRYQLEVTSAGFEQTRSESTFIGSGARTTLDVRLQISPIEQSVLVTPAATGVPQAQIGAAATVIDASTIEALGNGDLLEPLRTVPGAAIVQTGGRGGTASLFLRGGASNFTKVLIDGVPAN